jgi:alkanesulfonate monooxygenase SsuD/methylene tetrahydromethanopterin reductase-like flavin-dependent oxidoreductase (luciferase family)
MPRNAASTVSARTSITRTRTVSCPVRTSWAAFAKLTNGSNVAIVQMGATLPTSNPPIRVAEEYAMLDCISGGRLVAGLPLGSPMDVNFCYGITPMEHRERYREAFALTLKAWQAREIFAWNGRYYQLAEVNLWPRPIQPPHPPVWVPGSGSISTFDFAVDNDACYCFLSYSGGKSANSMMKRCWQVVSDKGREPNPYRAGFLQLVAVADTDAQAEAKYARHVEYFYQKCLHLPLHLLSPAGNQDYCSLVASLTSPMRRIDLCRAGRAFRRRDAALEDARRAVQQPLLPGVDLVRMNSIRARQLGNRPVALDRRQRHLGLERRPVLLACLLHVLLPRHQRF